MNKTCQAAPEEVRAPRFALPKGATDAHFHVFGPAVKFAYVPTREYTPPDALPATAERLFASASIERAVLVQATVYGRDNRRHLTAAAEMRIPTRVVVVTDLDTPIGDLSEMHDRGARGVRFILAHDGGLSAQDLEPFADKLKDLGWHVQLMLKPAQLVELERRLDRLSCPVVIDHIGMIDPAGGLAQPAFRALLRLVGNGNCWVKLSGFYRLSHEGAPYRDMRDMIGALAAEAPGRLFWGSDWPHPLFSGAMPNLADLIEPLPDWIPDAAVRQRVLVDNPAEFYGFDKFAETSVRIGN